MLPTHMPVLLTCFTANHYTAMLHTSPAAACLFNLPPGESKCVPAYTLHVTFSVRFMFVSLADDAAVGHRPVNSGMGACICSGQGAGLLEIKCPFNRGDPGGATPPKLPQWYYMPQVGLW